MIDLLKKSIYATIGLAVMTREKAEDFARNLASEAKMSENEGRKFIDDIVKKSEEGKGALQKMIHDTVDAILKKMNLATRKELSDLETRVRILEANQQDKK